MVAIQYPMVFLMLCGVAVARHHKLEVSEVSMDTPKDADSSAVNTEQRHRRKRWYTSYGYQQPLYRNDAPPPAPPAQVTYDPFAYIYRRLDELTSLIRQPPPPIQGPILIPYPVYVSTGCSCSNGGTPGNGTPEMMPNITLPTRIKDDDDDYDDLPLRPLSFEPVKPDTPLSRPVPAVEHGSSQAGIPSQQPSGFPPPAPAFSAVPTVKFEPSRCDIATLTCCHQRFTTNRCFESLGCPITQRNDNPCSTNAITNVLQVFKNFYKND